MPQLNPQTNSVAGAIEGEKLKIVSKSGGDASPQGMGGFPKGKWSGNSQLWWTGAKPKDTLVLEGKIEKAGNYEVFVVLSKAVDYGIVLLTVDSFKPQPPLDLYNTEVVNTSPISLGTYTLKEGGHQLKIEITGANPNAVKNYMFGIDYLLLVPREPGKKE